MTEKQFTFLKVVYDQENARMGVLLERGKSFLTVITLYFTAFTWKVADLDVFTKSTPCVRLLTLATGVSLLAALFFTVQSLKLLAGERILDLRQVTTKLINTPVEDSEFWKERAVDLSVAGERNAACNDKRANGLVRAHTSLVVAVICHLLAFTVYSFTS